MTHSAKALAWILGGVVLCAGAAPAFAVSAGNPYLENITNRNVFSLKPTPPPPDPAELNKPKPSKITLTGIMTILGKKQALMKAPPLPPTKPGELPKEQSYILAEGQRDGEIEVLHIDEHAGSVQILNAGLTETLTFSTNAPALAGAVPGLPVPGGFGRPGVNPFTRPGEGMRGIPMPNRTLRLPPAAGASSPGFGGGMPAVGGGASVGGLNFGGAQQPVTTSTSASSSGPHYTLEQAALIAETARLRNEELRASGIPRPPIPQLPFLRGSQPNQAPAQQTPPLAPTIPPVPPTQ